MQTKLTVGAPNDRYEQEADRVAEQVMSTPDSAAQPAIQRQEGEEEEMQMKPLSATITPLVQREGMPEEEELQMKPLGHIQREGMPEEEELQMKPLGHIQREAMPEEEELQMKPALQRSTQGSLPPAAVWKLSSTPAKAAVVRCPLKFVPSWNPDLVTTSAKYGCIRAVRRCR